MLTGKLYTVQLRDALYLERALTYRISRRAGVST
jgi:hypothetical protein